MTRPSLRLALPRSLRLALPRSLRLALPRSLRFALPATLLLAVAACSDDTTNATSATATDTTTDGGTDATTEPGTSTTSTSTSTASGSETVGDTMATTSPTTTSTTEPTTTTTTTTAETDPTTSSTTVTTDTDTTDTDTDTTTGSDDVCGNGIDDDDDGEIDEGCPCEVDQTQPCYPYPESGVGACDAGTQKCVDSTWGPCEGAVAPVDEICDGVDNNCEGATDETCLCKEGDVEACYPGPDGTADVGICVSGSHSCVIMDGVADWGTCEGFVLPEATDTCNDTIDNDCDGLVDVQVASLGVCAKDPIPAPPVCTDAQLKPDLGGLTKKTFNFTAADQPFVVPGGVTSIWVKLWGAGGGSWNAQQGGAGGAGGFTIAKLTVTPNEQLTVIVGEAGQDSFAQTMIYGGGGHGGFFAGNGGGRTAIRRGVTELATAGAGGGAGGCNVNQPCPDGGAGGGPVGVDGEDPPLGDATYGTRGFGATSTCGGAGGTTTCGCTLDAGMGGGGSQFQGGVTILGAPGQGGGGGGGGWFGGGSGGGDCALNTGGSGGGGSSWVDANDGCVVAGVGSIAANSVDPDHPANAGNGGAPGQDGYPGFAVIYY